MRKLASRPLPRQTTLDLLADLASLVRKHDLAKGDKALSIVCPEGKLRIDDDQFEEPDDGAGEKRRITVGDVQFRISLIAPKDKPEKEKPLPAKEFALYRAGLYDMQAIRRMPWHEYRPFVMTLFNVRDHPNERYGLAFDGYVGTHPALIWNFPEHPQLKLDYGFAGY